MVQVKKSHIQKMTFEHRPEGGEEVKFSVACVLSTSGREEHAWFDLGAAWR
jgi:hypothetical protein